MGKLKINPDFTGEEVETKPVSEEEMDNFVKDEDADEGGEGSKKTEDEESEEEGEQSESSTDDKPGGESEEAADDVKAQKERELQGLKAEEAKLNTDLDGLDKEIKETRERIAQKRGDRRHLREEARSAPPEKKEEVDLSDVDPADIERVEKIVRSRGYMTRQEYEKENLSTSQKQIEDSFYKDHPQYLPANDANDELYNALKEEIALLGAQPKNSQQAAKVLQYAHSQVVSRFPSRFPKAVPKGGTSDAASRARMNLAGTGTGSPGSSAKRGKSQSNLSAEDRQTLLDGGFSAEEVDEM